MTTTVFSAKVIHISDAEVDYPKDGKLPVISLPNDGPSETKDNGESTKFTDNEKCSNLMPSEGKFYILYCNFLICLIF